MALFFVLLSVRGWTRTADNWYVACYVVSGRFLLAIRAFIFMSLSIILENAKENVFTGFAEI
jgi:hypothetical protein